MPRTIVTRDELAVYLTAEFQKVRDCEGCSINTIWPLQEPDEDGCNWSSQVYVSSGEMFQPITFDRMQSGSSQKRRNDLIYAMNKDNDANQHP